MSSAPAARARDERALRGMAAGFGVGSLLFALGTVQLWADARLAAANLTYVLGAVCFTSAATVQWRAAVWHNPNRAELGARIEWDLANPDWVSAATQLVGTLYFNVMTIRALVQSLGGDVTTTQVWRPDAIGSVLFLVSSTVALAPAARQRRHRLISERSWVICVSNMAGSVFFGVSAWGQQTLPDGTMRSEALANWGTFLGALGFLLAAVLLWPARRRTRNA